MAIETIKVAKLVTLSKGIIITTVIAAVGYFAYKLTRKAEEKVGDEFGLAIRRSAAHWLAPRLNASEEQIEKVLALWIDEGKQDSILVSVLRIEYEVTRGKTVCPVKVTIALMQEGKIVVGEVIQKMSCGDLPENIREKFIRSVDKNSQNFVLVEYQKC